MIKATGHVCNYLESIETKHDLYSISTEPKIKRRIIIADKVTRKRD